MVLQADTVSKKMEIRRNLLLHGIFRDGSKGRRELGRNLRMSKSRLFEVVQEMIDEELIVENLEGIKRRGRIPIPLSCNPDYGCFVGLDIELTRMRIVVVTFSGQVLFQRRQHLSPIKDRKMLLSRLLKFVDEGLAAAQELKVRVLGIGVAAPGIIHKSTGTLVRYDLIEAVHNIPLRDVVEDHTHLPCVVDNNMSCYALTEWTSGAAKGMSDFILLSVRSGFGSAIMLGGKLLNGSHGFSSEAGSSPVPNNKPVSQWKTLHELVSETALEVNPDARDMTLSKKKAQAAGEILGAQAASLASLLDPEAIVIAGKLLELEGALWNSVERTYRRFILPGVTDGVQLLHSQAGPFAAAVGATQRCFQELFPTSADSDRESILDSAV
jgi:predicted NBD/HSP70 family sugar kinase